MPTRLLIQEGVWWLRALSNADAAMVTRCLISRQGSRLISMATAEAGLSGKQNVHQRQSLSLLSPVPLVMSWSCFSVKRRDKVPGCVWLSRWRGDVKVLEGRILGGCAWGCGWTAAWASGWLQRVDSWEQNKPIETEIALFFFHISNFWNLTLDLKIACSYWVTQWGRCL